VTKFDKVDELLDLPHHGRTRCRLSLNAEPVARRLEGGTASVDARLQALRKLALPKALGGGGYPVGVVLAPIMPIPDWPVHYGQLLDRIGQALDFDCDLTFELISHRFTPGSKDVLTGVVPQYQPRHGRGPAGRQAQQVRRRQVRVHARRDEDLRRYFEREVAARFPRARVLYWT
jgi:spore photoproduct lyase